MKKSELNIKDTTELQKAVAKEIGSKDDEERFIELLETSEDSGEDIEEPGEDL